MSLSGISLFYFFVDTLRDSEYDCTIQRKGCTIMRFAFAAEFNFFYFWRKK